MHTDKGPRTIHGGVARLVEAERGWQQSLDAARADMRAVVVRAQADAAERELRADEDIRHCVAERQRELDARLAAAVAEVQASFEAQTERYVHAPDALIDRLADDIGDRTPWFAAAARIP